MMLLTYNSAARHRNRSRSKEFSEADATKSIQQRIYFGVGPRFLGWNADVAEPRFWKSPAVEDRLKWNPLLEHLKGEFRGLVWAGSTHVPFVTVEHDRHDATVLTEPHVLQVIATGRLLTRGFSSALGYRLNWCVEVNPRNGSVKFFGWGDQPIPIEIARKIGEQIHDEMHTKGILGSKDRREVYPFNHPQVMLPMRTDKTTIIDSGVLPKCTRKKREYDCDDEPRPIITEPDFFKIERVYQSERATFKLVPYETYSVLAFWNWLRRGGHYSEQALLTTLRAASASMPDRIVPVEEPEPQEVKLLPGDGEGDCTRKYQGEAADNPNSYERQHDALLVYCRQMKRVVTEGEALRYIRVNRLFTDSWEYNLGRRRARVRSILKRIAETFDPGKCRGVRHDVQIGKFDKWARHHVGTIKGHDRYGMDEFGNAVITKNRYKVGWQFASVFLSVVEYCLITAPNDDDSLPQDRAEEVWRRCYESGLINVRFCDRKWATCRDWLEGKGLIKVVDRNWHRDKAMRWKVLPEFHRLPQWWRTQKRLGLLEAVPLEEFLEKGMEQQQGLNSYSYNEQGPLVHWPDFSSVSIRPPP